MDKLQKYHMKRDFGVTSEPKGRKTHSDPRRLAFSVQHHAARSDHYDLRLEWDGVAMSWALPKGPSFCTADKRLAVHVEDHPVDYMRFEGVIPKGEYGGGTVMLWDVGVWTPRLDVEEGLKNGSLKFRLDGLRLKGDWALVRMNGSGEQENWLLIKERDAYAKRTPGVGNFTRSVLSGMTMYEIAASKGHIEPIVTPPKNGQAEVMGVKITSPEKPMFTRPSLKKFDLIKYYAAVAQRMLPHLEDRPLSLVCCPSGIGGERFFRRHLEGRLRGVGEVPSDDEPYFCITDKTGVISLAQYNAVEFHVSGRRKKSARPDVMIFDLDPDEGLPLAAVRKGARALKDVLEELGLKTFLKTSGGKGYHIVVPLRANAESETFRDFSKQVALLMENAYPTLFTANISKRARGGKIFLDWQRNSPGSTSVAPYSLRARDGAPVSMPIAWEELGRVAPNGVTLRGALMRLKKPDPWADFFAVKASQSLKKAKL